jgi:hypothetical protein
MDFHCLAEIGDFSNTFAFPSLCLSWIKYRQRAGTVKKNGWKKHK